MTAALLNRPIDGSLITEVQSSLRAYFDKIGRPFVTIEVPAQNVGSGTLVVVVTEPKIGAIRVEGNRWFDDRQYIRAIRDQPGDPIDTSRLFADTDWINRNANRQAKLLIGPGTKPDTYDLTIRAQDHLPLSLTLAGDNTGTNQTGLYRIAAGFDWSNALWRGDDLNYTFVTSADGSRLREHVASYTAYLPWHDTLTLTGVVENTHSTAPDGSYGDTGYYDAVSLRYTIWLPDFAGAVNYLGFGYDFKTTNTNILSGGTETFGTPSEIDQFIANYQLQRGDNLGWTSLTFMFVGSPGNLSANNTLAAFQAQQPAATPNYLYGRLNLERLTNLPAGLSWDARLTAQYSSANLLPSEQLVFGGVTSVRGFVEQGALRDEGALWQNELRAAPLKTGLLQQLGYAEDKEAVLPFMFLDLGMGRNHIDVPGLNRSWLEMISVGPGIAWQVTRATVFRFTWGVPLVRNGHVGPLLGPSFGAQITF